TIGVLGGGRGVDLEIGIDRTNPVGELTVQLTGLPPGVSCAPVTVPAGEGTAVAKLRLNASINVLNVQQDVVVQVLRGGETLDQKSLALQTTAFLRPELDEVFRIELTQGAWTDIVTIVKRNGNNDPLTL